MLKIREKEFLPLPKTPEKSGKQRAIIFPPNRSSSKTNNIHLTENHFELISPAIILQFYFMTIFPTN
jgi:hypothetical protein